MAKMLQSTLDKKSGFRLFTQGQEDTRPRFMDETEQFAVESGCIKLSVVL